MVNRLNLLCTYIYSGNLDNKVTKNDAAEVCAVEIRNKQPYIDWHFNNSTDDYTTRIIETEAGILEVWGSNGRTLKTKNGKGEVCPVCTASNALYFQWNSGHLEVWVDVTHVGNINF